MHQFTGKVILILIMISFVIGSMWVAIHPNYTRAHNIRSNRDYYPSVKVDDKSAETRDTAEESGDEGY